MATLSPLQTAMLMEQIRIRQLLEQLCLNQAEILECLLQANQQREEIRRAIAA